MKCAGKVTFQHQNATLRVPRLTEMSKDGRVEPIERKKMHLHRQNGCSLCVEKRKVEGERVMFLQPCPKCRKIMLQTSVTTGYTEYACITCGIKVRGTPCFDDYSTTYTIYSGGTITLDRRPKNERNSLNV